MSLEIKVERAFNGECIWLRFGNEKKSNILIDSGPARFAIGFEKIMKTIQNRNEEVNLLILTHIDNDHILGFKNYILKNDCKLINKIWLNGDGVVYGIIRTILCLQNT